MSKYLDLYIQGCSINEIAEKMKCSRQNVELHLKKEGIEPKSRKRKDHLGKEFPTKTEMCAHWNVPVGTFNSREGKGWSLQECLEGRTTNKDNREKKITDPMGNKFHNQEEMCEYWGVNYDAFKARLYQYNYTLEEALFGKVKDHLGNRYHTEEDMAKKWGVKYSTYTQRKYVHKYSLQECLEGRVNNEMVHKFKIKFVRWKKSKKWCSIENSLSMKDKELIDRVLDANSDGSFEKSDWDKCDSIIDKIRELSKEIK